MELMTAHPFFEKLWAAAIGSSPLVEEKGKMEFA